MTTNFKEVRHQRDLAAALATIGPEGTQDPAAVGAAIGVSPVVTEGLLRELVAAGQLRIERPKRTRRSDRPADGFWPEFRRPTEEEAAEVVAAAEGRKLYEATAARMALVLGVPVEVADHGAGFSIVVASVALTALDQRLGGILEALTELEVAS